MGMLLHLSDLHLATAEHDLSTGDYKSEVVPKEERQARRREIEATLTALGERLRATSRRLDAVVLTGDITYQHSEEGFRLLRPTLERLGRSLPAPDRVVVLPGNHDVKWGTPSASADRYARFCHWVRDEFGYRTPMLEGIDLDASGRTARRAPVRELVVDCTEAGFVIVPMNSTDFCGVVPADHPVARLDPTKLKESLDILDHRVSDELRRWLSRTSTDDVARVSQAQLKALRAALSRRGPEGAIVIAALHHHLLPVSSAEEVKPYADLTNLGQVRSFLSRNTDIVLHGHKHQENIYLDRVDRTNSLGDDDEDQLLVVSSGTTGTGLTSAAMRLVVVGENGSNRAVRIEDVAPVQDGGDLRERSRGIWYLPDSRQTHHAEVSLRFSTVSGTTLDATYDALRALFERVQISTPSQPPELFGLDCVVQDGASCLKVPASYPLRDEFWPSWFEETVRWWQSTDVPTASAYGFSHGLRMRRHGGWFDQIKAATAVLRDRPSTSRGVISLVEPARDLRLELAPEAPSFSLVQLRVNNEKLHVTGFFRKQEMRFWWPINVAELATIQKEIIADLARNGGQRLQPGAITTHADRAVLSATPPRVVIPFLDRLSAASEGQARMRRMAAATAGSGHVDHVAAASDWEIAVTQWAPPFEYAVDGSPVSLVGTRELAVLVEEFDRRAGLRPALGRRLGDIVSANEQFAAERRAAMDGSAEMAAFGVWRTRLAEILPPTRRLIRERLKAHQ